jgi:hypothetical protein
MPEPFVHPPLNAETEGMRQIITALVHQLGGSAFVDRAEIVRVLNEGWTVHVTHDTEDNFTFKEVQA